MALTVEQPVAPSADVVGNAFVHQYYLILRQSPELVHRFYQDVSKLGRPEADGLMAITSTMQAIDEKILSPDYKVTRAEILTVDAQESHQGGFIVLVTGCLTDKEFIRRDFTQTFFLAPQEKGGYFVLNDIFRYVEDLQYQVDEQSRLNAVEAPLHPEEDPAPVEENHINEHSVTPVEENSNGEVYNPTDDCNGTTEEEEEAPPIPEVVDEVPDDTQIVIETIPEPYLRPEELPKKSYASILKAMREAAPSLSTYAPAPSRPVQKIQEQPIILAPPPAPVLETPVPISENGNNNEAEEEGHSIYIKGLPMNATPALLENEFKKFGPIKNGGIQVRGQKGFCFGFVEFETEEAVQSAMAASPIVIGGRRAVIEEKRSKGMTRGRSAGGFRNDGIRAPGNYGGGGGGGGGRGFNRNESFNRNDSFSRNESFNRNEFGNRSGNRGAGGFSNRGGRAGDGYQRSESRGNRGGGGGLIANDGVKTSATQRVSAPA